MYGGKAGDSLSRDQRGQRRKPFMRTNMAKILHNNGIGSVLERLVLAAKRITPELFLAWVAAISKRGGFKTRNEANRQGGMSTSDEAVTYMRNPDRAAQENIQPDEEDKQKARAALEWARQRAQAGGLRDFERKVMQAAAKQFITKSDYGIVAYLLPMYEKANPQAQLEEPAEDLPPAPAVGEELAARGTITEVREMNIRGRTAYLNKFTDSDTGYKYSWWSNDGGLSNLVGKEIYIQAKVRQELNKYGEITLENRGADRVKVINKDRYEDIKSGKAKPAPEIPTGQVELDLTFDSTHRISHQWGFVSKYMFYDDHGRQFSWKTSKDPDLETGQRYRLRANIPEDKDERIDRFDGSIRLLKPEILAVGDKETASDEVLEDLRERHKEASRLAKHYSKLYEEGLKLIEQRAEQAGGLLSHPPDKLVDPVEFGKRANWFMESIEKASAAAASGQAFEKERFPGGGSYTLPNFWKAPPGVRPETKMRPVTPQEFMGEAAQVLEQSRKMLAESQEAYNNYVGLSQVPEGDPNYQAAQNEMNKLKRYFSSERGPEFKDSLWGGSLTSLVEDPGLLDRAEADFARAQQAATAGETAFEPDAQIWKTKVPYRKTEPRSPQEIADVLTTALNRSIALKDQMRHEIAEIQEYKRLADAYDKSFVKLNGILKRLMRGRNLGIIETEALLKWIGMACKFGAISPRV